MNFNPYRTHSERFALALSAAALLMAGAVMVGWYLHVRWIVQVLPDVAPMQFNTAFGLALGAASLLAGSFGKRDWAFGLGLATLSWGALVLLEYALGVDTGVDRLFVHPFVTEHASTSGRMSVNSAAAFVVTGAALATLASPFARRTASILGALLSTINIAMGFNAILGYLVGVEAAYGWTYHSQMALHTATGFVLLGIAGFLRAWSEGVSAYGDAPAWVVLPVLIGGLLVSVGIWEMLEDREADQARRTIAADARGLAQLLRESAQERMNAARRMADRLARMPDLPRGVWAADATNYLRQLDGTRMILVLRNDGSLRWVIPEYDALSAADVKAVLADQQQESWRQIVNSGRPVVTFAIQLHPNDLIYKIYVPILRDGQFQGALVFVIDYEGLFDSIASVPLSRGYAIELRENERSLYFAGPPAYELAPAWQASAIVGVAESSWWVRVVPTHAAVQRLRSRAHVLALVLGIVLSLGLAGAVRYSRKASLQSRALADANARLQAEVTERRRSEHRFRLILELAPNALLIVDPSGRILQANKQAVRIFGHSRRELHGLSIEALMPERFRQRHGRLRLEYLDAPHIRAMGSGLKLLGQRKDGSEFPVDVSLGPMHTEQGTQIIAAITDMTAYLKAEAERRLLQDRFQRVVEATPNALIIADAEGRIQLVNSQALRWFGYEREELIGQPVELLMPESARGTHLEHRQRYLASPSTRPMGAGLRIEARRKDGSVFPVDISLSPVTTDEGPSVIAAVADMTQRREVEAELERSNAHLGLVNRELEAFSYSVSHDLRAPLRSMTGFAQILLEDYADCVDETGRDYLQRVRNSAERMGRLIDDLLALSRLTRAEVTRAAVDLTAVAEDIVGELRGREPERAVDVRIEPALGAECDARLLRVLLNNLLGNAWKFTGRTEAACIEVGRASSDNGATFFVRDNGAGFDMAYADKLFGAFQRLHATDEFPGTGIGLATAQRVVMRHGGRIWAEGEVGHGATFYFTFSTS